MVRGAADEFKKRTNGKYEIQVFPASSLGKESDINQGLQLGTVDIILTGASFAARSFPRLAVSYYPFTFRDADHVIKYSKSDVFKELTEELKASGGSTVTALTYYGARHATSSKLFTNCDQMKGLKMRVPDAPAYTAPPRPAAPTRRRSPSPRSTWPCRTAPSTPRRTRCPPSRPRSSSRCRRTSSSRATSRTRC